MPTNDNEPGPPSGSLSPSHAHGQAALILTECLIHGLIARSVLTSEASLEIVNSAIDVQADYAAEAVDGAAIEMRQSQVLLSAIADSLKTDIAAPATPPSKPTLVDVNDPSNAAFRGRVDPPHGADEANE